MTMEEIGSTAVGTRAEAAQAFPTWADDSAHAFDILPTDVRPRTSDSRFPADADIRCPAYRKAPTRRLMQRLLKLACES
jgi:hypothetical protein